MLVNKIGFTPQYANVVVKKNNAPTSFEAPKYALPVAGHYSSHLSFTGYSLSLEESMQRLKEYEKSTGRIFFHRMCVKLQMIFLKKKILIN